MFCSKNNCKVTINLSNSKIFIKKNNKNIMTLSKKSDNKKVKRKKKMGRPKKRGPKKKRNRRKIVKIYKQRPVIDFKIVSVLNGKQNGFIGQYQTYSDAHNKLIELEKENQKIIFPRKYINKGNVSLIKEEYLLLEKNRFGDKEDGVSRNEFGKLIPQKIINNDKWVVREKIIKYTEETFWVYGYDPKLDRKTFSWIYDNIIIGEIENTYDIIKIYVYKNKLIIKYDEKPMKMVMCKNKNDCIRMYNLIDESSKKNKHILCVGSCDRISDFRRDLEKEIMSLTGWNKIKIQRSTN